LKKPYPVDPQVVRECCLFGSSVNAIKAKYGGYVKKAQVPEAAEFGLSDIGLRQLRMFYQEAKELGLDIPENFVEEGIWDHGDCYVLVIPAHVVPNPVSTVGMGDTISSSCYASEYSSILANK
jgi:ADP-dependent phosphofructokinase/glucokinase